ncbi:MAG: RNA polymerase subunit sigma-70 [Phycisphaerales bacterium]|nr:RNA polymerase subunit sigma-70 [Phycisphaerales bacterium]MCB9856779.1 RNA polymerase subunit sigma-70 [Phycisphaerales bacterium]MCB9862094.1 RNA polymerase subunit sigma-70 [Phycisphaerales bacterium]
MSGADDMANEPSQATPALFELVYQELRRLAADYLRRERPDHTLQPTALVHEAYVRLSELDRIEWRDRTHFYAAAAGAIRRVLVDHARGHNAAKRGGGWRRITLTGLGGGIGERDINILALDEALGRLAVLDARKARVVELRYFAGMTIEETARSLGVGSTTVDDDWAFAKSWLRRELGDDADSAQPDGV